MAEKNDDEKKYQASAKRLERMREEGQVLRAKEFYAGVTLIVALTIIYSFSQVFYDTFLSNFRLVFSNLDALIEDKVLTAHVFETLFFKNFLILLPLFVGILIAFLLSIHVLGGLSFPKSLIKFQLNKLNPMTNLKRIVSLNNLVDVGKSFLKIFLFLAILLVFLHGHITALFQLSSVHEMHQVTKIEDLLLDFLTDLILGIVIIALIDAAYNYYQFHQKAKMTFQEMKDETKETDGNPEMKRKIRQTQHAIALQRMSQEIPKAAVVITNPTHFAVALKYVEQVDEAPKVIAKGADHMAKHIRTLAVKHGIPIYEAPEFARAIYNNSKVGSYIHPDLYMAAAIVLSYILQLKAYQLGQGQMPQRVDDLKIPKELKDV